MALTLEQFGLDRLSADERAEVLELLWDSIPENGYVPPQWHIEILQKRLADPEPGDSIAWAEFKTRWLEQCQFRSTPR